jgi:putative ABC transport system permease protein
MRVRSIVGTALAATRTNALRSLLTSLGIAIAVSSVMMMVAVSSGARQEVENGIASLGTNVLHVYSGSNRVRGRSEGIGSRPSFTENDLQALKERVATITAGSGTLATAARLVWGGENWQTTVEGVHGEFLTVRDWAIGTGREFSPTEERNGQKVVILGATVAENLFADQDPVGSAVRIGNVPFDVIGVLAKKGQSSSGRDLDDVALVPVKTARSHLVMRQKILPLDVGNLVLKIHPGSSTQDAKAEIEEVLRVRRRVQTAADDDFFVRDLAEFLRTRAAAQDALGLLLSVTAAIALVVGGIGIMNVMLVSVSERTREIGLRIALGARQRDIMRQFLGEALVLCLLGCLLGVLMGQVGTVAINEVVEWPVKVTAGVTALAVLSAIVTGLVFGFYPARRAARLNPMAALQKE